MANDKARANSYDSAWQSAWVQKAQQILASTGNDQNEGMFILLGDSLSRSLSIGAWAIGGAGKTSEDVAICNWMHAGEAPQDITTLDGFYLQAPDKTIPPPNGYHCSNRSYTIGDGLGAFNYLDAGPMPAETNQTAARAILDNCATYSNDLNLTTILAAINKPQFALLTFNAKLSDPGTHPSGYVEICDELEANGIVPIIQTETYRFGNDPWPSNRCDDIDTANALRYSFAQARSYPLIDLQAECAARWPVTVRTRDGVIDAWRNRVIASGDDPHLTQTGFGARDGVGPYYHDDDPYADGGDPSSHTTGASLLYSGYALKGWLLVQKAKQLQELVLGPPVLGIADFSDEFEEETSVGLRNHTPDVGTSWTYVGTNDDCFQVTQAEDHIEPTMNEVVGESNGVGYDYISPDLGSADKVVWWNCGALVSSGFSYIAIRLTDENNFVGFRKGGTGASGYRLVKKVAGVEADLISFQGTADRWYRMKADGDTITLWISADATEPVDPESDTNWTQVSGNVPVTDFNDQTQTGVVNTGQVAQPLCLAFRASSLSPVVTTPIVILVPTGPEG